VKKRRMLEAEGRYRRLGRTGSAPGAREHDAPAEQAPQVRARPASRRRAAQCARS
jgi:hypothetical protein